MHSLALCALMFSSALDWAAYSPLDVPLEIESRDKDDGVARVYAARGEYEGLHLAITANKKPIANLTIEPEAPGRDVPPPLVFRMLPVTGPELKTECLDVLAPPSPATVAPGETAHYWIRYAIPAAAKPGVRQTEVRLMADGERAVKVPVRLEIFDLTLPERPSLPNVFFLDRGAMRSVFSLKDPALDPWKPYYLAMGGYRLGFSLWDGTGLTNGDDTTALRDHYSFAADALGPAALDLAGGNGSGWKAAPKPGPGQKIDPLNLMLNGVATTPSLAALPVTAAFDNFPTRGTWPGTIALLDRLSSGSRLTRVALAPLHPDFAPALDAWAVPFRACNPALVARFQSGADISGVPGLPPARITASTSDTNTSGSFYESIPADAADGSPFSAWFPLRTSTKAEDCWWQADFDAPQQVESAELDWLNAHEANNVELWTTIDGANYARSNVKWEHNPAQNPFDLPTSTATLRFPGRMLGIRFVIHISSGDKQPALAEVRLPGLPIEASPVSRPHKLWLALELDTFPTTYPGRPPVEPRIIGWASWFGGLHGVLGASLDAWPKSLIERTTGAPFEIPRSGGDFLFYPVDGELLPSMRLERLRDGLEDYEYLRLLGQALERGDKLPQGARDLLQPLALSPAPTDDQLNDWAKLILENRIKIGRVLGEKK